MTYLFIALIIAAIGYAVYRARASFRDETLPGPTGSVEPEQPVKPRRPIDKR